MKQSLIVFTIAFLFRIAAINAFPHEIFGDEVEYAALAYNLHAHHAFSFGEPHAWGREPRIPGRGPLKPTAARAPLFPFVLSLLWGSDFSIPVARMQMVNALAGALTAVLCARLALALFGGMAAWASGIGVALAPETAFMSTALMSESLFMLLVIAAVELWQKERFAWSGLLFGLATLTRSIFFPVLVLGLAAGLVTRRRNLWLAAGVGLLVVMPWTIRNWTSTGSFVPVNTQGWGSNLLFGTISTPYGSGNPWCVFATHPLLLEALDGTADESATEQRMKQIAMREILAHPGQWFLTRLHEFPHALMSSSTFLYRFSPFPQQVNRVIFLAMTPLLLVVALMGLIKNRDELARLLPLAVPPAVLLASQVISLADFRYTLPVIPLLIVLASSLLAKKPAVGVATPAVQAVTA